MREIELEIFESGCTKHKVGDKYKYPEDIGKMCTWLVESAIPMIKVLRHGGKLGWSYKGTPYEKIISLKDTRLIYIIKCIISHQLFPTIYIHFTNAPYS